MDPTWSNVGILVQFKSTAQAVTCVPAAAGVEIHSQHNPQKKRCSCAPEQVFREKLRILRNSAYWWDNLHISSPLMSHHSRKESISIPTNKDRPWRVLCQPRAHLRSFFKDSQWFPLRWLCNVALICFLSALQGPETRQRSWRRQG